MAPPLPAVPAPEVLRTFVAVVPSEATTSALAAEAERIAHADRAARVVSRENLHLTLVFLGATAAGAVPAIVDALERGLVGVAPVRIRPVGLSAFPSPRSPRVVFAALAPDTHHALEVLAGRVADALAAVGQAPDHAERFHPHVTLARIGGARIGGARRERAQIEAPSPTLKKLLSAGALHGTYIDDVVTDVRLLSSEPAAGATASQGTVYRVLASIPLGSGMAVGSLASPASSNPSSASAGRA